MKIKVLIFDTETGGLPKNYKPAEEDLTNYPNLVQYSGKLIEINLNEVVSKKYKIIYNFTNLVQPIRNGKLITIDEGATKTHGISIEDCYKGVAIETIALMHQGLCTSADLVICHNYGFDRNVMASELLNIGISPSIKKSGKVLCTMKYMTNVIKLPNTKGNGFKFPSLAELFYFLTDLKLSDYYKAHDAEGDVNATIHCFIEMLNQDQKLVAWLKNETTAIY
jgi:DNA polymerase III epsilon subunit-like protein